MSPGSSERTPAAQSKRPFFVRFDRMGGMKVWASSGAQAERDALACMPPGVRVAEVFSPPEALLPEGVEGGVSPLPEGQK